MWQWIQFQDIQKVLPRRGGQKNRTKLLNWTEQKNRTIANNSGTEQKQFSSVQFKSWFISLVQNSSVQNSSALKVQKFDFVWFFFIYIFFWKNHSVFYIIFNNTNNNNSAKKKQFGSVRNSSIQFEMKTIQFGSIILI